jgi:hypothetical protein
MEGRQTESIRCIDSLITAIFQDRFNPLHITIKGMGHQQGAL